MRHKSILSSYSRLAETETFQGKDAGTKGLNFPEFLGVSAHASLHQQRLLELSWPGALFF